MLVLKLLGYAFIIYALLIAYMYLAQNNYVFFPDPKNYTQADVNVSGYTDLTITTSDGLNLTGWYIPAKSGKPTIVLFHGNASTYQWRAADFKPLAEHGYGILMAGYRGYGGNPGKPSEDGFYKDADAYISALKGPLVLYGESLGTGVVVDMAARHPDRVQAIVLENPYTSLPDLARYHYPFVPFVKQITKNKFLSIDKITSLKMPKLFLISGADQIVPPEFGKQLFEAAPEPKIIKIYEGLPHVGIRDHNGLEDMRAFLNGL